MVNTFHCKIVIRRPEGRYHFSKMFCWESEGRCDHRICTPIVPFWYSTENLWILIVPFWLSIDNRLTCDHRIVVEQRNVIYSSDTVRCQCHLMFQSSERNLRRGEKIRDVTLKIDEEILIKAFLDWNPNTFDVYWGKFCRTWGSL